jgi:hypothetical protein
MGNRHAGDEIGELRRISGDVGRPAGWQWGLFRGAWGLSPCQRIAVAGVRVKYAY